MKEHEMDEHEPAKPDDRRSEWWPCPTCHGLGLQWLPTTVPTTLVRKLCSTCGGSGKAKDGRMRERVEHGLLMRVDPERFYFDDTRDD